MELSVIVPVFNVKKYLERCLNSILNQTYYVGEIICIDDGSTDGSGDILDRYSSAHDRIKVLHKSNEGLVSARKEGLLRAKGDYIAYVDSDDWIERNMYEEMVKLAKRNKADIVTSGCIRDYDNHSINEQENIRAGVYEGEKLEQELLNNMIATDCFFASNISIHIFNKIFKKSLLLKYQMMVDNYVNVGEDAACVYPCMLNAKRVVVSGKSYYHYCMRNDSIMAGKRADETQRLKVLFAGLFREVEEQKKRIRNITMQFDFLRYYLLLLQKVENVVFQEGVMLFPFGNIQKKDRVIIYGAGKFGQELKRFLEERLCCQIVAWIDKSSEPDKSEIQSIEHLDIVDYDKIIIAVLLNNIVEKIRNELMERRIPEEKIFQIDCRLLQNGLGEKILFYE